MIDFNSIKKAQTLDGKIDIFTNENLQRVADYITVIQEGKARKNLTIDEIKSRIKKLFMKLDGEWFFDDNKKRFDKIKANFLETDVVYEGSKLKRHLTSENIIERNCNLIREILEK
jgi:hypothetical protein